MKFYYTSNNLVLYVSFKISIQTNTIYMLYKKFRKITDNQYKIQAFISTIKQKQKNVIQENSSIYQQNKIEAKKSDTRNKQGNLQMFETQKKVSFVKSQITSIKFKNLLAQQIRSKKKEINKVIYKCLKHKKRQVSQNHRQPVQNSRIYQHNKLSDKRNKQGNLQMFEIQKKEGTSNNFIRRNQKFPKFLIFHLSAFLVILLLLSQKYFSLNLQEN
eukprot:TRINITY_DN4424_c0_g1_i11.p1 TRINITY_DN4424_c0_g1~~TRINITY_DN4424_c0_g1_i11.p1  ORF type:complete len:216 (+),score=-16.92 TRINITY_DN4424_c0_g1_i11:505-1152(+)